MTSKNNLSKLQIRAEILAAIQHLYSFEDTPRALQNQYIDKIKKIKEVNYVLEILIKELFKYDYKKSKIIAAFLIEIGSLESIGDILWEYVKDPKVSDEIKDCLTIVLRGLGDTTDAEDYLNYFQDPGETIEKETERLLAVSYVDPEAQIDFMDFLFSLPPKDQQTLLHSLKDDYPGDYLANLLLAILECDLDEEVEKAAIEVLGETKSGSAISKLKEIHDSTKDQSIKKLAKKSLNTLKIAGINKEIPDTKGSIICEQSSIYECYTSCPDGMGNQGLLISRLKPSGDIIMFSVVINDIDGIIDCFGFNGISKFDFSRILDKFQENSVRILVPPEYCKHKLDNAINNNKITNNVIPYEYTAWSSLIYDFPQSGDIDLTECNECLNKELIEQSDSLFKFPAFNHWFLDDNDSDYIKESLQNIIKQAINNKDYFAKDSNILLKWLDDETTSIIKNYFNSENIKIIKNRLLDTAYLLNILNLPNFRNVTYSVAEIITDKNSSLENIPFIRKFIKKTIYEAFVRYQYDLNIGENTPKIVALNGKETELAQSTESQANSAEFEAKSLSIIVKILEVNW